MKTSLPASTFRKTILTVLLAAPIALVTFSSRSLFAASGPCTAPSTDYGSVTQTVSVPATATYRVWSRLAAADSTNNTYMLEIDGTSCYAIGGSTVPVYANGSTTFFVNNTTNWISKTSAGTQVDVSLTSGNHTFKLIGAAPNVVLDRLVLTQDITCVPTGTGDNCANPPDTTAPVVSVTSPASGASISSTTTVTANATDDVAVTKVEFYVDGTLKSTDTTGSSNNYTYSLNPASFTTGAHTLTAKAYDAAGNSTTSGSVAITILDSTAPSVSLTAPTAGATLSGTATLSATATDNVAVTKVEFYVDGSLKGSDTTGTSNSYSISLDTTALSDASHSFTAKAYDAAGNVTTSSAVNATVNNATPPPSDTTPPTVSVTGPAAGSTVSGAVAVSATASDASGIAKVEFYVDNVLKNTDTTAPYSFNLDTTTLSNGTHTFKAVATDKASTPNSATSTVVSAIVNNVVYKSADINQDGAVNIQDFGLLKAKFNQSGSSLGRADINGDSVVDIRDFGILKTQFGT